MKQIIIISLVVIGIIVGATMLGDKEQQVTAEQSNNFYGNEDGVITVTEYGDFQCPACAGFFPIISQVKEEMKDQIRFEFKHFPLVQIHTNAQAAHRAAQAAANQGKFWEMHDLLYSQQQSWSSVSSPASVFEGYAEQLELDMEKYRSEVNSSEVLATINADIEAGKEIGANSTPTFVIDGKKIEDTTAISTVEGMKEYIENAIAEKTGEPVEDTSQPDATEVEEQTGE